MRSFSSLSSPFALILVRQTHSEVRVGQGTTHNPRFGASTPESGTASERPWPQASGLHELRYCHPGPLQGGQLDPHFRSEILRAEPRHTTP